MGLMRKLTALSLSALVAMAAGYAAKRYLGARDGEWQTVGAAPSPGAASDTGPRPTAPDTGMAPTPYDAQHDEAPPQSLSPEPIDLGTQPADTEAEPADLYDVEPDAYAGADDAAVETADPDDADDAAETEAAAWAGEESDAAPAETPRKPFDPLTDPLPPDEEY